jgi:predicted AAA+ superfamily ATPase
MDTLKPHPSRYLAPAIRSDLERRMVFIGGPRQVGKTTLSLHLLGKSADESHPAYFNWDSTEDRKKLMEGKLPPGERLVILDEIHKYSRWRNFVKGLYDKNKSHYQFLITGSARLDYYRRGGDSLLGRYHYLRLHPLSLREIDPACSAKPLKNLLAYGGFPEPYFAADPVLHRRWLHERHQRVLQEDLRDLEHVKEISLLEELLGHLPACVGSPLSLSSLKNLLGVAYESVDRWVDIFERLYLCFRVPPFGSKRIRAVRKEQKLYFWDWSTIPDPGPRFENLVASQLLKYSHWVEDIQGHRMELRYIRDTDKREVDFVVLRDGQPEFAVECKTGERSISPTAAYFKERLPIPAFYQVHLGTQDFVHASTGIRVLPFQTFCRELSLP